MPRRETAWRPAVARLSERPAGWAGYAAFGWTEPWFLGLGVLVTLGALHHHRRTGGSARAAYRLAWLTVAGVLLLSAIACAIVVMRSV